MNKKKASYSRRTGDDRRRKTGRTENSSVVSSGKSSDYKSSVQKTPREATKALFSVIAQGDQLIPA